MYCPACGAEYEPGVTRCADCSVALVAERPDAPTTRSVQYVDLAEVLSGPDPGEIAVVKSILDGEQIPYTIQGGFPGVYAGAVRQRVLVSEADLPRVKVLLEHLIVSRPTGESTTSTHPWTCPACHEEVDDGFYQCWNCGKERP